MADKDSELEREAEVLAFGAAWQIRQLIARHRYGNKIIIDLHRLLRNTYRQLAMEIADTAEDETLILELQERATRVKLLLQELTVSGKYLASVALAEATPVFAESVRSQLKVARQAVSLASRMQLIQTARLPVIVENLVVGGLPWSDLWEASANAAIRRAQSTIQTGILLGKSPRDIAREIWTRDRKTRDLADMHMAQWNMVVRTSTAAVQTESTLAELRTLPTAQAPIVPGSSPSSTPTDGRPVSITPDGKHVSITPDGKHVSITPDGEPLVTTASENTGERREVIGVVGHVRLEAILDSRTSELCMALDGNIYELEDPRIPKPPLHPNCRSALVPISDAEMWLHDGTPPRISYAEWLSNQPINVQNAILGKAKAEMFRNGDITLAHLINADGSIATIEQIKRYLGIQ